MNNSLFFHFGEVQYFHQLDALEGNGVSRTAAQIMGRSGRGGTRLLTLFQVGLRGPDFFDVSLGFGGRKAGNSINATSVLGVLRLRAIHPLLRVDPRGASLRMTVLWGG
jgi:hypothetical protein